MWHCDQWIMGGKVSVLTKAVQWTARLPEFPDLRLSVDFDVISYLRLVMFKLGVYSSPIRASHDLKGTCSITLLVLNSRYFLS